MGAFCADAAPASAGLARQGSGQHERRGPRYSPDHPEGSEASGSGEHQADAGSDAYDRDFALSLLSKEQDGLYEIEQALARIDNGTYGICEMSYKVIPILRLEAIPFARLTVECQAQWEKKKARMPGSVPEVALGFAGGQNDVDLSVSLDDDEE